jgi:rhodanese-related sulfurtransferase
MSSPEAAHKDAPNATPPAADPPAVRLSRTNWIARLTRTDTGVPLLPPEFVIEQGLLVQIVDVRDDEEMIGPLGHIPGVTWVPYAEIQRVAQVLPPDAMVVLVCRSGDRSVEAVRELEARGMTFVAAMEGGMVAWKKMGFAIARDVSYRERTAQTLTWNPRALAVPAAPAGQAAHAPAAERLALPQILEHVGDPRAVRWVKMGAFLLHGKISCVDGRDDNGVVGTPGGDAGEFLLALAAAELVTSKPISRAAQKTLLAAYMDAFGHFYLHSDTAALNRFILSMRSDPRLADELPPRTTQGPGWRKYMACPPEKLRAIMLEHLLVPEHIGCGHLRLMLQNSDEYGIRSELVLGMIEEYYKQLWAGAIETQFVVLGGGHLEGAVVSVRIEREIWPFTCIPLVSPACNGTQMFVSHPEVTAYLRRNIAAFMTTRPETGVGRADLDALLEKMTVLGQKQLEATLARLAPGLPVFEARFESEHSFAVTGG